ncbi:hypothetical protein BDZ90DRAFT_7897 [Jaminaea rosea]|uniref:Uncharacterized protein n=1 Tax=Jaminaea rosea TaxID=1569628 RepID=A0A316UY59_9BASI|nr:hypothetical protein BDZ90DRAFT_7897 [Jaminaea rosea]PWN30239.1 hypothetical protein BDZ90DRAFT_7897 [Jaminaea rosea]
MSEVALRFMEQASIDASRLETASWWRQWQSHAVNAVASCPGAPPADFAQRLGQILGSGHGNGCVYLAVALDDTQDRVTGWYGGRTGDNTARCAEHLMDIAFGSNALFHGHAASAQTTLTFNIFIYTEDILSPESILQRAILEGITSLCLGSCQRYPGLLAHRALCGLPAFEGNKGLNATACFEAPKAPADDYDGGSSLVRNHQYRKARRRQGLCHYMLQWAQTTEDAEEVEAARANLDAAGEAFTVVFGTLMRAWELRFRYLSTWLGAQPPKRFVRDMRNLVLGVGGGESGSEDGDDDEGDGDDHSDEYDEADDEWLLGLREGETTSCTSLGEAHRHLLSGICIVGKARNGRPGERVWYSHPAGKDNTFAFWEQIAKLSRDAAARESAFRASLEAIVARRPVGFASLSVDAQAAIDGKPFLYGEEREGGDLTFPSGITLHLASQWSKEDRERFREVAGIKRIPASKDDVGQKWEAVPFRLVRWTAAHQWRRGRTRGYRTGWKGVDTTIHKHLQTGMDPSSPSSDERSPIWPAGPPRPRPRRPCPSPPLVRMKMLRL